MHYRTVKLASFALYKLNFSSRDNVTLAPKDTEARTLLNISENIFSYQNEKQFSPPNLSGYSLKNNISNCRKLSDASKFYLISHPQHKYKSFTLKQNAQTFKTQWDENKITYLKWHRPRRKDSLNRPVLFKQTKLIQPSIYKIPAYYDNIYCKIQKKQTFLTE